MRSCRLKRKKGGMAREFSQMRSFQEVINKCKLIDAGYSESCFTWRRGKKKSNQIKERLDRFFINLAMPILNPIIKVHHLNFLSSDHRPIGASWDIRNEIKAVKNSKPIMRFEESWIKLKDAKKVIEDCWENQNGGGAVNFNAKILRCINKLHIWNKNRLKGSLKKAIAAKEVELQKLYAESNDQKWEEIIKAETDLEDLLEEEEDYWRIRLRDD